MLVEAPIEHPEQAQRLVELPVVVGRGGQQAAKARVAIGKSPARFTWLNIQIGAVNSTGSIQ